jgi:tetratricopeptide (TPR) repeat protein
LDEAANVYRRILQTDSGNPYALHYLGVLEASAGNLDQAKSLLERSLAHQPTNGQFVENYATVLAQAGDDEAALQICRQQLQVDDRNVSLLYVSAVALFKLRRLEEALAQLGKLLSIDPHHVAAINERGSVLAELAKFDAALDCVQQALTLQPRYADAYLNLGNLYAALKRYDGAFAAYEKAQALKPDLADAHFNEALLRLSLGELTEGWEKYEYRWQTKWSAGQKRNLRQPLWLGDIDIRNKTILVHAERGFGDTLLGCRYIPMVAQLGARVVAEVQAPLKSLLKNLDGISMVIGQGETIPHVDAHCPIMSLPLAFKTTMKTIPDKTPYLAASKDTVEKWRSKLIGKEIKVGIGWAGNTNFRSDRHRSILLKNLLPALAVEGVRYFSIQKTLRPGDEQLLDANPAIIRLDREINDFQDTAAIMMSLDLVVSSDTSIVNLAGALGRPFWVLLHDTPDWRWLASGKHTPWYPTGRLFRQRAIGDWTTVTDEVRAELEKLVASR